MLTLKQRHGHKRHFLQSRHSNPPNIIDQLAQLLDRDFSSRPILRHRTEKFYKGKPRRSSKRYQRIKRSHPLQSRKPSDKN